MRKISIITALCVFSVLEAGSGLAETVTLEREQVRFCFDKAERLERLRCYDRVLNRPGFSDEGTRDKDEAENIPQALAFAMSLLETRDRVENRVHITLIDRETGDRLRGGRYGGVFELIDIMIPQEEYDVLREESDMFLAMKSEEKIGEPAILVLSCEGDISHLKLYLGTPFEGKYADARFYGSSALGSDMVEQRSMWVRGAGHALESPRGLDTIKLLRRLTTGSLGQISIGEGREPRSAFFDTDALTEALPYLARHCGWVINVETIVQASEEIAQDVNANQTSVSSEPSN